MQTLTRTRAGAHNTPMTGYKTGAATRRKILLALLEREPRTIRELATAASYDYGNTWRVVKMLERDGLVIVERSIGRHGSAVRLTAAGKGAAQLLD